MKTLLKFGTATTLAVLLAASPANADDIEVSIEAALKAYRDGDLNMAKEELDFAAQLLAQKKNEQIMAVLPEPLDGWTRRENQNNSPGMAMFGGGVAVSAQYERDRDRVEIQIMAQNQMVATMVNMFSNAAMMASMGTVKRIGRQKVVITNNNEVQALVDNQILIQIGGNAPVEDKEAYFQAIDLEALKARL